MASLINTKYGKLSRFEIYNNFAIKRDIDWIHELLHDDFMYVQDYTMKTREEAIEMVKELLALNLYPTQTTLLYENENMMALEHEMITEGKKYLMTQVQLWRADNIWREVSNEREIVKWKDYYLHFCFA